MTFEELNRVRILKKQINAESLKIKALRTTVECITPKYKRERLDKKSFPALDLSPHGNFAGSKIENLVPLIVESETNLEQLQDDYKNAVAELTKQIQSEFPDPTEQTILLYRYVACMHFRDIAFSLKYSESRIYQIHNNILKRL